MTNYPLHWPNQRRRIAKDERIRARFRRGTMPVSVAGGCERVLRSLASIGVDLATVVISSNRKPRTDGLPASGQAEPEDAGVAVYWLAHQGTRTAKVARCLAVDQYDRAADNLAAIAATLEALRTVERHGGRAVMEQAFTGFEALPSPEVWRHVFGLEDAQVVTLAEVKQLYRALAPSRHPDTGGTHEAMAQLNAAMRAAEQVLR